MLIFIRSLSHVGLASHPLSARKNMEEGWLVCVCWARDHPAKRTAWVHPLSEKTRAKLKFTNACKAVKSCTKRASTNKATYLSLKSDFGGDFGHFLEELMHVRDSRERRVWIQRVLRDFAVWRPTENGAWRGSCPESLRWVCEWLWGSRGGGDILTTYISSILHFSLLFVVKEASQLWIAKSSVGSSL